MDLEKIASRKSNFATKKVGDDLVLVPMKDNVAQMNEMFTLNDVGAFIWDNLNETSTNEQLSVSIVEEFEIDLSTASADLEDFLSQVQKMMNG